MATYPEDLSPDAKCPKCGELIWRDSAMGAQCDDRKICCKKCGQWFKVNCYMLFLTEEVDAPPEASVTDDGGAECPHCGQPLHDYQARKLAEEGRALVCSACTTTYHVEARTVFTTRKADDALQVKSHT